MEARPDQQQPPAAPSASAAAAVAAAERIADEVLFPAALGTDRAVSVPPGHLDRLATAGLYGLAGPTAAGGLAMEGAPFRSVVEALAGGCLTTTFVWVQHHRLVRALAHPDAPAGLRDEWLARLCAGERRAGLALGGLLSGQPQLLQARETAEGWVLDGTSPWVTGWAMVDVLLVAAHSPDGCLVWLVVDATADGGMVAERQSLVAVDASATVSLTFDGVRVPADRLLRIDARDDAEPSFGGALRTNGSLALGVAGRCCRLMGSSPLDEALAASRRRLDEAAPEALAAARADASALAVQAASALVVHTGSRSVGRDEHPQRLAREAMFLLVFGSRRGIRTALLERLAGGPAEA